MEKQVNGHQKAVAALVLGIVSCVSAFLGAFAVVGTVCGIVGIVMANKAKAEGNTEGIRKAGFIMSIIGTAVSGIVFVTAGLLVGSFLGAAMLV